MKWIAAALALFGLVLSTYGVLRVAYRGAMGEDVNYLSLLSSFLFGTRFQGPIRDTGLPYFDKSEWTGWRYIAWGFVLQAIGVIVSVL
jgi:hypothetical protein